MKQHKDETNQARLMIAVGVPAFGKVRNEFGNKTVRSSQLLGVAATDVPVEDIDKLALPYMVCNIRFPHWFLLKNTYRPI